MLERDRVQAALNQRVYKAADRLFHAQMAQAEGVTFLFRKSKEGGKTTRVTDEETIRRYFDGELDQDEADWYFIATERPNAEAADRLLNRALGKPVEQHAFVTQDGQDAPTRVAFVVIGDQSTITYGDRPKLGLPRIIEAKCESPTGGRDE